MLVKARTGQKAAVPGSCGSPKAGQGSFQLILEAYRAYKSGEPPTWDLSK